MKKCFNNKKIFKSVIGVLLILLFCSAIVDYAFMLKNSNQSKTEEQLKEIGEQLATSIEIHLQDMLVTVKTLAKAYSIQYNEDLHQEDALYLLKESISNTNFERIWLTKIEGEAISSDGLTIDASQREYIEYAREGKSGYFLIEKSLVTESEKLLIYSPIYQEDLVIGILIGIYPLEYLNQIIDISCFGGNGLIEILKEDTGECIATNENVLQEESIQKVDGKDYTYETGIDNTGLRLVVTRPYKLFYEESRNLFLLSLLFYVKITIVVGTLIFDRYLSKNQELRHLADSDSMTNLFNRGKIEDEIQLVLKKQLINRAAFILFDVDKFKLVNDTLGHIAGDEIGRAHV